MHRSHTDLAVATRGDQLFLLISFQLRLVGDDDLLLFLDVLLVLVDLFRVLGLRRHLASLGVGFQSGLSEF